MKSRCPEGQGARENENRPKALLKRRVSSGGGIVALCPLKTCQNARQNANSPSSPREGGLGGRSISADCTVKKKLDVFDRQKELQDWFFVLTCAPACLCLGVCRSHRRCPEPVGRLRFQLLVRVGLLHFLAFGSRLAFALFRFWIAPGV